MRHAVVSGASMSGLLAARALVEDYDRVTVVDRDPLPADVGHRRGVPQARHFHTILLRGAQVLDEMFPGLVDELVAAGGHQADFLSEARLVVAGHELVRTVTGASDIQTTRPVLEGAIRARVANHPGVEILSGCDVVGPVVEGGRVTGVRIVRDGVGDVLDADLVVDAMGRSGRARAWLASMGFPTPAEDRIDVDMVYASRLVRPAAPFPDKLVLVGPVPGRPTGFAFAAQEGGRWMVTAVGMAGDHPPTDEAGYLAFLKRSAPPDVHDAIAAAEPLTEIRLHRFPASLRRRYERLRRFPPGLLVFGDALCSFNPIYGQGMTVAALEAQALRRCLRDGERDLARRFFRAAAGIVDPVWQLNAGGDLALPEIIGHRPLTTRLLNRYVARLQRVGAHDPVVATAFVRAIGLLDPPSSMMRPGVLARVVVGGMRRS
ncbi:FAD-dependent oxidoreductase [Saccharothrix sp. ALI-22-I]|uniref:FAD-dependent oxidoreductase n=1 Tax=Saccharothrix sp. ALI-22-I TaxID=1933778 RepID=UPI001930E8B6|nr:tryptophan 7-halogenase [Saccharothrix sp. ALI-22-I]